MSTQQIKTIVLIDDDPIANMISTKIIEKTYTYRVMAFTNAIYALDQLKEWASSALGGFPAVIFLDINMPHMDGWVFLEEYQKLPNIFLDKCSVFLLTSSMEYDDIQKSKTYKCVEEFISKPLTNDKLGHITQLSAYYK
ncbi:MAG: response regulator [Cyclobacteriaceae bacterium]